MELDLTCTFGIRGKALIRTFIALSKKYKKEKGIAFSYVFFWGALHCKIFGEQKTRWVMGKETIEDLIISKLHSFFFFQPGITTETFIKKRKKETEELLFLGKMAINITNNCNK